MSAVTTLVCDDPRHPRDVAVGDTFRGDGFRAAGWDRWGKIDRCPWCVSHFGIPKVGSGGRPVPPELLRAVAVANAAVSR